MKRLLFLLIFLFHLMQALGQQMNSKSGYVKFFSEALVEDITAENKNAKAVFDTQSGEVAFLVPISDFEFRKSLMKEHFNENYMESEKYPNAIFKGRIEGIDMEKGQGMALAKGTFTIHGVSQEVEIPGTYSVKEDLLVLESIFWIVLEEYEIEIPRLVFQNIAEKVEVTIKFELK